MIITTPPTSALYVGLEWKLHVVRQPALGRLAIITFEKSLNDIFLGFCRGGNIAICGVLAPSSEYGLVQKGGGIRV